MTGSISSSDVYTLEELQARMKWGRAAMRQARRRGLQVHYVGNRGHILGKDFVQFIGRSPMSHAGGETSAKRSDMRPAVIPRPLMETIMQVLSRPNADLVQLLRSLLAAAEARTPDEVAE